MLQNCLYVMMNLKSIIRFFSLKAGLAVLSLIPFMNLIAQSPTHYPTGKDPIDFTPINIFVFIIVPILFVIIYLWWRSAKIKERKKKMEEKNTE
jgi:uncharacterized membrane protein